MAGGGCVVTLREAGRRREDRQQCGPVLPANQGGVATRGAAYFVARDLPNRMQSVAAGATSAFAGEADLGWQQL